MTPTEAEGLLLLDKPVGPTSHDAVAAARRALRIRRIGHTGTLDPFASGLLLLLVGRATRLAEYFDDLPKRYHAVMRLGIGTDTDDRTGVVTARSDLRDLSDEAIRAALRRQVGERLQRPPAFSAKKVDGQRAYAAAREGRPLDLPPVPVRIDNIRVSRIDLPDVALEITCGAGTYVRAIARDAGDDLGIPAHLAELRRVAIGAFSVDDAVTPEQFAAAADPAALLRSPAAAVAHLGTVEVDAAAARLLAHGRNLPAPGDTPDGPVAIVSAGDLVAVGHVKAGTLSPRKVLTRV